MKEIVSAEKPAFIEDLLLRDQWKRPIVHPADGSKPRGYVRVSTMAEALSDSYGLNRWQQGNIVKTLAKRPDLVLAAQVATTKQEVYEIVDAAGSENKIEASRGTSMHTLTELLDGGHPLPPSLPENVLAMLAAYRGTMVDWEVLDTEVFVVNDKIGVGGSYDKRMRQRSTGRIVIGDLKTGQNIENFALKTCMQVGMYDASDVYDLDHNRHTLEVDPGHTQGILIHLPWVDNPKDAECELRWLDLVTGRQAVREAVKVRALRGLKSAQICPRVK